MAPSIFPCFYINPPPLNSWLQSSSLSLSPSHCPVDCVCFSKKHSQGSLLFHICFCYPVMMMVEKDDLGLSLSLSSPKPTGNHDKSSGINRNRFPLNLMPSLLRSSSSSSLPPPPYLSIALAAPDHRTPSNDSFGSADRTSQAPIKAVGGAGEARSFLNVISINKQPVRVADDEETGVSSPNSTISSVSGKRSEREATVGDLDNDRTCSRGVSDEEDGDTSRKKLRLSKDQSAVLENSFKENHTLNPKQKLALSKRLGLRPRQVEVWFQNRRARTKLKQTEFDCEFLRKCCEQLTEENRKLQKEVQELRALKMSPQFYMQMTPPTTLTMCPSCERVSPPTSGAPARLPMNPWGAAIGQLEPIHP